MNPQKTEPCYVILRTDRDVVSVKLIVWTEAEAEAQVERLNALNGDEVTRYDWIKNRAQRRPPLVVGCTRTPSEAMPPGLYRVHWKSGGSSLAAVGQLHDGTLWFAPINWTSATTAGIASVAWDMVESTTRIDPGDAR